MKNSFKINSLALSIGLALGAAPAFAAGEDAGANPDEKTEKIAVVGSRAAPRSVSDSAVPVDVVSGDEFVKQGVTDMTSLLQNVVPSFNVNDQPINDASTLVRPANLRGLSSDSTLILVNGKRRHRSVRSLPSSAAASPTVHKVRISPLSLPTALQASRSAA